MVGAKIAQYLAEAFVLTVPKLLEQTPGSAGFKYALYQGAEWRVGSILALFGSDRKQNIKRLLPHVTRVEECAESGQNAAVADLGHGRERGVRLERLEARRDEHPAHPLDGRVTRRAKVCVVGLKRREAEPEKAGVLRVEGLEELVPPRVPHLLVLEHPLPDAAQHQQSQLTPCVSFHRQRRQALKEVGPPGGPLAFCDEGHELRGLLLDEPRLRQDVERPPRENLQGDLLELLPRVLGEGVPPARDEMLVELESKVARRVRHVRGGEQRGEPERLPILLLDAFAEVVRSPALLCRALGVVKDLQSLLHVFQRDTHTPPLPSPPPPSTLCLQVGQ
mmetsp:Transcript_16024/g.36993  ORF Transcript_16024/g.36993 Transcript_16024/m.36993 type:complete len:335 (+) Transcript_16024:1064-2068(+)